MKSKYIIGLVMGSIVAVVAVVFALQTQKTYVTFPEAAESGRQVQVRGTWVKEGGADYDPSENLFTFTMQDEDGNHMPIRFHDAKPNNFELAEEVVVGGRVENGEFLASDLLTKCPSKYEAETIEVTQAGY